jgi:hypothetical protein
MEEIKLQNSFELESSLIWNTLTDVLPGEFSPNRKLSYDSSDFGTISRKEITQILKEVFGAKPSKRHGNGSKLIFDKEMLERTGKVYDLSLEVRVIATNNNVEDGYDGVDVGLDKHLIEHDNSEENTESFIDNSKNHETISKNNIELTRTDEVKSSGIAVDPTHPTHPTQMTMNTVITSKEQQPSQATAEDIDVSDKIYRLGSTDLWACRHCKLKGDTWLMKKHLCIGSTK